MPSSHISMSLFATLGIGLLGLVGTAAEGQEQPLTIRTPTLEVSFEPVSAHLTVTTVAAHRQFISTGTLSASGGTARVVKVNDSTFGRGRAIEVVYPSGSRDAIMLFPHLPFVLFQSGVRNAQSQATIIKKWPALSVAVDLGRPPRELITFGTAGLLAPDQNPGSYAWMAVADPQSRQGVVGGWLTHRRGSGVVLSRIDKDLVCISAQIDYGRLPVTSEKTELLETFALGYFDDARLGLEEWADTIARIYRIRLRPQPVGYCTWYSRPHGGAADEKSLVQLAGFAAKQLAPFGFSVVQIDDGWQAGTSTNGPDRNFTRPKPNGPYRSGMKAIADQIKAAGLVPGLWFMPFAGTYYDPFFQARQEWFVKNADGKPFETRWGGTCLDLTQPAVQDYLRANIRRIAHDWGFQYFKMDGLWTGTGTQLMYVNEGYKDDGIGEAVFSQPDKTPIEAYRNGLKLIRETAGPEVFILGCCTPQNMRSYGGAFGLVDAMRIGPDNGADWTSLLRGPRFGSRHYFLHGRVWYNDPDPVYVRTNLSLQHAQMLCSWVALSGQLNLSSEWLAGLPPERLDLLRHTMPSHGLRPRPVDLFEEPIPRMWLLSDTRHAPRRDVIGLFNWSDKETLFDCSWPRLGLPDATNYVAFDYWQNALVPVRKQRLGLTAPPQSCRILAVRPALRRPQLISTSRHLTQGIVDVLEEKWQASRQTLRGRSQVVGGDPYELRIVLPSAGLPWKAESVQLDAADSAAAVKADLKMEKELVRVRLDSPSNRQVAWSVIFRQEEP
jgi:hypothetical protein